MLEPPLDSFSLFLFPLLVFFDGHYLTEKLKFKAKKASNIIS